MLNDSSSAVEIIRQHSNDQIKDEAADKVTRFTPTERSFHNIVMVTYLFMVVSGMFIIYYNLQGDRSIYREYYVIAHKTSGVMFFTGVLAVVAFGNRRIWQREHQADVPLRRPGPDVAYLKTLYGHH